ncbi:MAG: tyrosine recombinase XerC [Tenericutes bacterium]|nr:tyrosine recombinase XerC [Bacilli bacterium]NLV90442.1 tyrosine recombinase XerC [Mycoplasmatota bacterium]
MNYINDFINYLLNVRNYSENTIINYKIDLDEYYKYIKSNNIEILEIKYENINPFLATLYNIKHYSKSSVSRKISTLRSFYKYLYDNELIDKNPFLFISLPKKEKKLPRFVNYEDLDLILNSPDLNTDIGVRDRLILELLYGTGIRVSELCNIKIDDIDLKNKTIRIIGKGNKERIVLYGEYCENILEKYININRKNLLKDKDHSILILSNNGSNISVSTVQKILSNILKKVSIKKNITPHVFRHTFATHLLNEGCDILTVKELLGHSSLDTTQIYTHVSNEKLRQVYLDTHPRAKK